MILYGPIQMTGMFPTRVLIGLCRAAIVSLNSDFSLFIVLLKKDVVGVSHLGGLDTLSVKILQSNSPTSMGFILFHVPTNLLWRDISGSIIDKLSQSSLHPTIATGAETRLPSWKSMTLSTSAEKIPFMIIVNCKSHPLVSPQKMFNEGNQSSNLFFYSSQFDPAPRDETWHKSPRTPDYFL